MLSEDQNILEIVSRFCSTLRPLEDIFYLEHKYNDQLIPLAKEFNILGLPVKFKYGGLELSNVQYAQVIEKISAEGSGIRTFFSGHSSLGQKTIQRYNWIREMRDKFRDQRLGHTKDEFARLILSEMKENTPRFFENNIYKKSTILKILKNKSWGDD